MNRIYIRTSNSSSHIDNVLAGSAMNESITGTTMNDTDDTGQGGKCADSSPSHFHHLLLWNYYRCGYLYTNDTIETAYHN